MARPKEMDRRAQAFGYPTFMAMLLVEYIVYDRTANGIAKRLDMHPGTVRYWLKQYGIKKRTEFNDFRGT